MKKLLALALALVLVISMIPANVFAVEEVADPEWYIEDTYVYDFMRGEDGIFESFILQIVQVYEDGDTYPWMPEYFLSNSSREIQYGTLTLSDTQHTERWEVGNTYPVTYGDGRTFNVEVREVPIERIEINDCDFCVYDPDSGRYDYRTSCTVYYTNGTHEDELDFFNYEYYGYGYSTTLTYTDTQDQEPWVLGETYQVTGTLAGVSDTFNVTVICAEDIAVDDVVVIEGAGGMSGYWDEETQTYIDNAWMEYNIFPRNITISLTDGSEVSGSPYDLPRSIAYYLWWNSNQSYENQWGVGEHTAYIRLGDMTGEYKVIIQGKPVASIEIEDISVMEYTNGWMEGDIFRYNLSPKATITLTDGTEITDYYLDLGEDRYWIEWDSNIQYEQPWTAGNTYTVTGSLLGVTDTFTVTITEGPVESIDIQDVSIMEYTGGYWEDDVYYYQPDITGTITLKDGTVLTEGYLELDDTYYHIEMDASTQYEEPWTAGNTYTVTGSLMGVSDTFQVTILEAPVESIEIEDITFLEGEGHYWFREDRCVYDIYAVNATVTMKDGTEETITDGREIQIGEEWYYIDIDTSSQYETPWTAGNTYTATASLMGVSDTFNVTIQHTPVESVVFKDLVLYKGLDSYSYQNYDEYRFVPALEDVVLKDGSRPELLGDGILYEDKDYWVSSNATYMQYDKPWTPGNTYQVTGYLLGVKATFNVTILEDPIQEMKLVKAPTQGECLTGAYPNLKGATIRILYTDGTYEDVNISDDFTAGYYRTFYSKKLGRRTDIGTVDAFETAGQQTAEVELFGHTCKIPYTVKENKMQKLILTENADKSITVSVLNSDNTGFDMKLLDMCFVWEIEDGQYYGGVFTSIGMFECVILADDSSFTLALVTGGESTVISNTIGASEWFEVMTYIQDHPLYYMTDYEGAPKTYSGAITADNIDVIVEMAGIMGGIFYTGEAIEGADGSYYDLVSGAQVISAVKEFFAVENVDLSLSEHFDPQTGTYKHEHYLMGVGQVATTCPDQVSYKNGVWSVKSTVEAYGDILQIVEMKLNSQGKITGYSIGDGSVFSDVDTTSWQYSAAEYALENNLMAGKGTDSYGRVNFDPNNPITREEFVQVLYNAESKPPVDSDKVFPDVKNEWYKNAVLWAYEAGIASGMGDGKFGVGKNITRQDLAVMLYKYAKMKGYGLTAPAGKIDQFADGSRVSGYAKEAMNWAVHFGVLSGKGNAGDPISSFRLDPAGTATRAECAAMLRNFMTAFVEPAPFPPIEY